MTSERDLRVLFELIETLWNVNSDTAVKYIEFLEN